MPATVSIRWLVSWVTTVEQQCYRLARAQPAEEVEDGIEQHAALLLRLQNGRLGHVVQDDSDFRHQPRQIGSVPTNDIPQSRDRQVA